MQPFFYKKLIHDSVNMPPDFHISQSGARSLHLHAQQLLTAPVKSPDKAAVLHCIRQMSALQIDTINVVARSPYLVLWSRLGSYQQNWLNELLAEGKLFEYWSHEACFFTDRRFSSLSASHAISG